MNHESFSGTLGPYARAYGSVGLLPTLAWYSQLGAAANFDDLVIFGDRRQIRPSQMFIKLAFEFLSRVWRHFYVSTNHEVAR